MIAGQIAGGRGRALFAFFGDQFEPKGAGLARVPARYQLLGAAAALKAPALRRSTPGAAARLNLLEFLEGREFQQQSATRSGPSKEARASATGTQACWLWRGRGSRRIVSSQSRLTLEKVQPVQPLALFPTQRAPIKMT